MKNYFYQNSVIQLSSVPQGYVVSTSFNDRFSAFVELTQEQNDFYQANPTANVFEVSECRLISIEPTLPTLAERKAELIEKFAQMQKEVALLFLTAEKAVGADNTTLISLIEQARLQRAMTLQTIEGFTDIDVAMAFDIREEDCKPLKDELLNLINNVI